MAREESFIPTQEEPYGIGSSIATPATIPIVPGQGHPLIANYHNYHVWETQNQDKPRLSDIRGERIRLACPERNETYTAIQLNSQNLIKLLTN